MLPYALSAIADLYSERCVDICALSIYVNNNRISTHLNGFLNKCRIKCFAELVFIHLSNLKFPTKVA